MIGVVGDVGLGFASPGACDGVIVEPVVSAGP